MLTRYHDLPQVQLTPSPHALGLMAQLSHNGLLHRLRLATGAGRYTEVGELAAELARREVLAEDARLALHSSTLDAAIDNLGTAWDSYAIEGT